MQNSTTLESQIGLVANKFLEITKDKDIFVLSHFDTDGITSATIFYSNIKKIR